MDQAQEPKAGVTKKIARWWHYWAICGLLCAQMSLGVNYHVLVCNMPIADTLLLLIILYHPKSRLSHNYYDSVSLFLRIVGCTTFVAVLFVNSSHAMELLSSVGHGHSHGGEEEEAAAFNGTSHEISDDHEHEHGFGIIPKPYFVVCAIDAALKFIIVLCGYVPSMGLFKPLPLLFHTLCPLTVVGLYFAGDFITEDLADTWWWKNADPIAALSLSFLFMMLIIPAFKSLMPFIFAEMPSKLDEDSFYAELVEKQPAASISHLHAYRLWPGIAFEALVHVDIRVDKSKKDWSNEAYSLWIPTRDFITDYLSKAGAGSTVIEPRFVDTNEISSPWMGCIDEDCIKSDRGCCDGDTRSKSENCA